MVEASTLLRSEQFYVPSHRRIFVAMAALLERQSPINPILIGEELDKENAKESVGGVSFITNLTYGLPHSASVAHYAKVVRGKALLRELIKTANKITQTALDEEDEAETILECAEQEIFDLSIRAKLSSKSTLKSYSQVAGSVVDLFEKWHTGQTVAIPTQIPELDRKLAYGGLSLQDFIIIAARSSFGKTALALQISINTARSGIPVLIFPLEMAAEKLFIRNLSSLSDVSHYQIAPWTFQNNKAISGKILGGIPKLQDLPIHVDDQTYSLRRMSMVAREWKRRLGKQTGLIVIDYLQLTENNLDKRTRQEEVAGISNGVKRLAKELNVPIIGVSQFSRKPAQEHRRPELSDLRESGQLEQDADVVLFLWSEDGLKDVPLRAMKLYCPKQRNGQVGWELDIDFDGEHQWFSTEAMYRGVA
jgi:replicative DNA helicase